MYYVLRNVYRVRARYQHPNLKFIGEIQLISKFPNIIDQFSHKLNRNCTSQLDFVRYNQLMITQCDSKFKLTPYKLLE